MLDSSSGAAKRRDSAESDVGILSKKMDAKTSTAPVLTPSTSILSSPSRYLSSSQSDSDIKKPRGYESSGGRGGQPEIDMAAVSSTFEPGSHHLIASFGATAETTGGTGGDQVNLTIKESGDSQYQQHLDPGDPEEDAGDELFNVEALTLSGQQLFDLKELQEIEAERRKLIQQMNSVIGGIGDYMGEVFDRFAREWSDYVNSILHREYFPGIPASLDILRRNEEIQKKLQKYIKSFNEMSDEMKVIET